MTTDVTSLMRRLIGVAALVLVVAVVAAASASAAPGGSLTITATGLPSGQQPSILLTGPRLRLAARNRVSHRSRERRSDRQRRELRGTVGVNADLPRQRHVRLWLRPGHLQRHRGHQHRPLHHRRPADIAERRLGAPRS